MRRLTFGMNVSLDGYTAAPGDDLGWSSPSDELFQWWSDRVGATALRCPAIWRHTGAAGVRRPPAGHATGGLIDEYAIVLAGHAPAAWEDPSGIAASRG